jgi:hypothetical protein
MNRLALALAATILGTGCIVVDDDHPAACTRTVTVDWSFENADGGQTSDCTTAGVSALDVFVNGYFADRFSCAGAPGTVQVAGGTNDLIVEAIDSGGTVRYRDYKTVDANVCGHQGTVASMPGQGWLEVAYTFSPTNACYPTQPTYMWLQVFDDVAQQIAFLETDMTSFQVCSVTLAGPRYAVPVGSFTFDGIEEVLPVGGGATTTVRADCTARPFDVNFLAVTTVRPQLVSSGAHCF